VEISEYMEEVAHNFRTRNGKVIENPWGEYSVWVILNHGKFGKVPFNIPYSMMIPYDDGELYKKVEWNGKEHIRYKMTRGAHNSFTWGKKIYYCDKCKKYVNTDKRGGKRVCKECGTEIPRSNIRRMFRSTKAAEKGVDWEKIEKMIELKVKREAELYQDFFKGELTATDIIGGKHVSYKEEPKKREPIELELAKKTSGDEYVQIEARIVKETEKSLLLKLEDGPEFWCPKSQIKGKYDDEFEGYQEIWVKKWVLRKNIK